MGQEKDDAAVSGAERLDEEGVVVVQRPKEGDHVLRSELRDGRPERDV